MGSKLPPRVATVAERATPPPGTHGRGASRKKFTTKVAGGRGKNAHHREIARRQVGRAAGPEWSPVHYGRRVRVYPLAEPHIRLNVRLGSEAEVQQTRAGCLLLAISGHRATGVRSRISSEIACTEVAKQGFELPLLAITGHSLVLRVSVNDGVKVRHLGGVKMHHRRGGSLSMESTGGLRARRAVFPFVRPPWLGYPTTAW